MSQAIAANGVISARVSGTRRWVFLLLAVLAFALLFARSMSRFFDLDEHQFVVPPILLDHEGLLPYADYPYFHMPGLVYLYAPLLAWTPHKLLAARLVSVGCGFAALVLLFRVGWRLFRHLPESTRWLLAGGMALIFGCSRLFTYTSGWAWNHDSAVLCALGAFLVHVRGLRSARLRFFAAAGALAGLALCIRLSFALIVLPLALSLLFGRSALTPRQRVLGLGLAMAAALVVLTPALVHLWSQPEAFLFGNLGYARLNTLFYSTVRSPAMNLPQKLLHLLQSFFSDPGNAVLFLLALWLLGWRYFRLRAWRSRYGNELLLVMGFLPALLAGCWGPTPTQYQYYYMLLPFLTLGILYLLALESTRPTAWLHYRRLLAIGVLVVGLTGLPRWYWPVVQIASPEKWVPMSVDVLGEWIRTQCPAEGRVLTLDPLFPLEGGVRVYPDYAVGRFFVHVGEHMSAADRQRHHILWAEQVEQLLARQPPDAVFCDRRTRHMSLAFIHYAEGHGFHKLDAPDGTGTLWVRAP
jgi:hypothetical protein